MLMVLLRKAVCHQLVEMLCFIERKRLFLYFYYLKLTN